MQKRRRNLIFIGALVIVIVGAAYLWSRNGSDKLSYRVEKVDRGDIVVSISATGTLNAVTTVLVGSQVSGTISKIYVDYNSQVREGELLAQIDPTFLQATVSEQSANVDRAQAQVNEAARNFERTKQLFEKSLISQAELDAAITSLETAQASLKQAEASLERAKVNLRYATIRSPIDGVVISRDVDVGQTVAASLSAPTLFTIANDLSRMQVEASIDEADIGNVKEGQKVTFRVDSYPEEEFTGKVSQIRLAPVVSQNVVTYNVIIDVSNSELKLMPGMTANVIIEVARRDDVLRAPLQALRFVPPVETRAAADKTGDTASKAMPVARIRPDGMKAESRDPSRARLWILDGVTPKAVPIVRGLQSTRYVEIVEGELKEGDEVIVGMEGAVAGNAAVTGQNPFMPRFGGGRR
ncbi:MAG: efflux RND transporter periplasmic adaptor subunit [Candidatus Zixiibacteriota bacterium]|jgi:HlyD family secretion protein